MIDRKKGGAEIVHTIQENIECSSVQYIHNIKLIKERIPFSPESLPFRLDPVKPLSLNIQEKLPHIVGTSRPSVNLSPERL
jgi:hypothetical protein